MIHKRSLSLQARVRYVADFAAVEVLPLGALKHHKEARRDLQETVLLSLACMLCGAQWPSE
jgi:hypothetical protein